MNNSPLQVIVWINGAELTMEVDTDATLSIISHRTYQRVWSKENTQELNHPKPALGRIPEKLSTFWANFK